LALLALSAAACERQADTSSPPAAVVATTVSDSGPVVVPASAAEVRRMIETSGARALVLNAWASWCGPCRQEMPDLVRLRDAYRDRGVRVVLLSFDLESSVADARRFLAGHGVTDTTLIRGDTENDQEFLQNLDPRWSGALPATWVFDGAGHARSFWEGRATYPRLEQAVLAALDNPTRAHP
jgi:thiol-disulfide isomerase/thioredoxin